MTDTFERSLAHWSEAGRRGMDAFYSLATADYQVLAEACDWVGWLREAAAQAKRPLSLLDVACGSGRFPSALVRYGGVGDADLEPIRYALLDPSPFSIAEARSSLRPPFVAGEVHECTIQDLDPEAGPFDVVWATHALYAVPPAELDDAMQRFLAVCRGRSFLAHAAERSHYIAFDRLYRADFSQTDRTPYATGEEVIASLERLGARPSVREIEYETMAPADSEAVEGFLQRCVFDDSRSLADMVRGDTVGPYLARCRWAEGWRFRQAVKLIFVGV